MASRAYLLGGLALVLGLGAIAVASSSGPSGPDAVTGLPKGNGFEYRVTPAGLQRFRNGKPLSSAVENVAFNLWQQAEFKKRQATLPADANRGMFSAGDKYSKQAYWITPYVDSNTNVPVVLIDEFGRLYPGHYEASGPSTPWDAVTIMFSNPLFNAVLVGALVAMGPQGVAIYGAYEAWKHRGEGLTPKSAILLAGRTYATSQCGPGCGAAFDMGVGVASGKRIDESAEDALIGSMTPQQKIAYENGRKAYRSMM